MERERDPACPWAVKTCTSWLDSGTCKNGEEKCNYAHDYRAERTLMKSRAFLEAHKEAAKLMHIHQGLSEMSSDASGSVRGDE